jgi:hypothetical protein
MGQRRRRQADYGGHCAPKLRARGLVEQPEAGDAPKLAALQEAAIGLIASLRRDVEIAANPGGEIGR